MTAPDRAPVPGRADALRTSDKAVPDGSARSARPTERGGTRAFRALQTALFALALGTLLLLTNMRLAATQPAVYEYSFSRYDAVERTGVPRAELDRAAREIVTYFGSGHEQYLDIDVTVDGQVEPLFNEREVLHMSDVRVLFRRVFFVQQLAFVAVALYVAISVFRYRAAAVQRLAREATLAGVGVAAVLVLAAVGIATAFHWLFDQFHFISFASGTWTFDPLTDRLIQMFPDGFWFDVTMAVGVLTLVQALLIALLGYVVLRHRARQIREADSADAVVTRGAP